MTYFKTTDFFIEVKKGNVPAHKIIQKFGRNADVDTSMVDITMEDVVYDWPTTNNTLEAISDDANDASAGTGARTIIVEGLDINGAEISSTITMNGTSASTATSESYFRVNRAYILTQGIYSTTTTGGNAGIITIRISGAGATQAIISTDPIANGQTQQCRYTVPTTATDDNGVLFTVKGAILIGIGAHVDGNKEADIYYWRRKSADTVVAPFGAKRMILMLDGVSGDSDAENNLLYQRFDPFEDIWTSAEATAVNTEVEARFTLLLY